MDSVRSFSGNGGDSYSQDSKFVLGRVKILNKGENMMKFKINYSGKYEDSIVIQGETIEEIGKKTNQEIKKRNWKRENCTSEQLDF